MGNLKICRVCSVADPERVKDGMIRCVRKHKFVDPEGTCPDHSNITLDEAEHLREVFRDGLYKYLDVKGKSKK